MPRIPASRVLLPSRSRQQMIESRGDFRHVADDDLSAKLRAHSVQLRVRLITMPQLPRTSQSSHRKPYPWTRNTRCRGRRAITCSLCIEPQRNGPTNQLLPACRTGRRRADVRIEATLLGAKSYAAISIVMAPEYQAIRPALLVIHIGECAEISKGHASGSYAGWTCGSRTGVRTGRGGTCRARRATAAILA